MREIKAGLIKNTVRDLALRANFVLRPDAQAALKEAFQKEKNARAKNILKAIVENAAIAKRDKLAICQDTGLPIVFIELGQDAHIAGGSLKEAVNAGISLAYREGFLRNSVIKDPLERGSSSFVPALIHTEIVWGGKLKLTVLPKGFGCENKSQVKMFNPTVGLDKIKEFIVNAVQSAGSDACPPYVVGVGIGGTQDYACLLAKKVLLKKIKNQKSKVKITNKNSKIKKFEKELLVEINNLNIGPMGLGGKMTCLGVNIETYPTHIAGLPVAVNISCHALRSASIKL